MAAERLKSRKGIVEIAAEHPLGVGVACLVLDWPRSVAFLEPTCWMPHV